MEGDAVIRPPPVTTAVNKNLVLAAVLSFSNSGNEAMGSALCAAVKGDGVSLKILLLGSEEDQLTVANGCCPLIPPTKLLSSIDCPAESALLSVTVSVGVKSSIVGKTTADEDVDISTVA